MQSFLFPQVLTLRVGTFPLKKGEYLILLLKVLSRPVCQSHDWPSLNPLVAIGPLFHCSESILYLKLILHTRASISSPRTSVEVAALFTDSFTASVSSEQSSLSIFGKENILFLGDFCILGLVT